MDRRNAIWYIRDCVAEQLASNMNLFFRTFFRYCNIMKIFVSYVYFQSPSSDYNFTFFCKHELKMRENIDYVIAVNGYKCDIDIPNLANVTVIKRPNVGFDFGAHNHVLAYLDSKNKMYDYYIFINSGAFGPVVPYYISDHWSSFFIKKINAIVKLVGTSIVCLPPTDIGQYGPKIEGFFFVTDKIGLKLLRNEKTIFFDHPTKESAIVNGEYGLSRCIFRHGYSIDCMLRKYQTVNWKDRRNWNLNDNKHPTRQNSFFGHTINPYEVIFHKWYWHDLPTVNFDIIKDYVDSIN